MKRSVMLVCAVVAMFGLSACTPEEQAAVIADYAAMRTAEDARVAAPTWSVDADCGGAHIVLSGWTGVTDISPSSGQAYVMLGLGGTNIGVGLVDGGVDAYIPADQGTRDTPGWSWSLVINGEPALTATGIADC